MPARSAHRWSGPRQDRMRRRAGRCLAEISGMSPRQMTAASMSPGSARSHRRRAGRKTFGIVGVVDEVDGLAGEGRAHLIVLMSVATVTDEATEGERRIDNAGEHGFAVEISAVSLLAAPSRLDRPAARTRAATRGAEAGDRAALPSRGWGRRRSPSKAARAEAHHVFQVTNSRQQARARSRSR